MLGQPEFGRVEINLWQCGKRALPGIATGFRGVIRGHPGCSTLDPRLGPERSSEATESLGGGIAGRPAERPPPAIAGNYLPLHVYQNAGAVPTYPSPPAAVIGLEACSHPTLSNACVPLIGRDERVAAGQVTRTGRPSTSRLVGRPRLTILASI